MRYTGPTGKGFRGDKAKAASLQGVARKLVGEVVAKLKAPPFNGNGHLVDRKRLDDGSWLHVLVNMIGMHPIVRTWVESPVFGVEKQDDKRNDYELLSGLFDGRNFSWETDGFIRQVQRLDYNGSWRRLGWENSELLVPSICETAPLGCAGISQDVLSVRNAYAGCYSGKMKKVVQLLLGTAVDEEGQKITKPVLYSFCIEQSHGIFTARDGTPWVIEISDDNGVTAWRLPLLPRSENLTRGVNLSYFPAPVDTLPDIEDRVLLMPVEDLDPVYSERMHMGRYYGWAFSESGSRAISVFYKGGGDDYYQSCVATITIVEGEEGPISANLSLTANKYLHGHYDTLTHAKIAANMGVSGISIRSVAISQAWVSGPAPPSEQAPVFAYFVGEKAVIVYHHSYWGHYPSKLNYWLTTGVTRPQPYGLGVVTGAPFEVLIIPFGEREGFYIYQAIAYPQMDGINRETLTYFYRDKSYTVFDQSVMEALDVVLSPFVFFNAAPWTEPSLPQYMSVRIDPFTGIGSVSAEIDKYQHKFRYQISPLESKYDVASVMSRSSGFFGLPFYDVMVG